VLHRKILKNDKSINLKSHPIINKYSNCDSKWTLKYTEVSALKKGVTVVNSGSRPIDKYTTNIGAYG
jgi:hypothetical protein